MIERATLGLTAAGLVLVTFLVSEFFNNLDQNNFRHQVRDFMHGGGNRFTAEDGYRLCERIQHLEEQHHDTPGRCKKPEEKVED